MEKILNFANDLSSAEDEAQDLAWDAWDAPTKGQAVKLAKEALKLDAYCCDAFNVLAFYERDTEKRKEYFKKAIDSFHKRYDKKFFDENTGYFWGVLETRPYMRTLQDYGKTLWDSGETSQAVETYKNMLILNPNDNQGMRFVLLNWMFITKDLKGVHKILKQYKSGIGGILFSRLLNSLIENKDEKEIRKAFAKVTEYNQYFLPFLLGTQNLPKTIPDQFTLGSADEAAVYLLDEYGKDAWAAYPEALERLAQLQKD
jgi:tetratricopeptide (TPR) repeat protein